MASNKRTPSQIELDRLQVAEWYCQGKSQVWIAAQLGLSQQQISYDMRAVRNQWAERTYETINAHIAEELAKIDHLEQTYWLGYFESQKPKTRATITGTGEGAIVRDRQTETREEGGAQFLQGVERCIKLRMDLLGLNAPQRIALTDWRKEAQDAGVDPQQLLDDRVKQFQEALLSGTLPVSS